MPKGIINLYVNLLRWKTDVNVSTKKLKYFKTARTPTLHIIANVVNNFA